MPWASEKQRKWAHATGQPWAKEWDRKYAEGGSTMGLLDNKDEDLTITRKMQNGSSVTYKSPQGSQVEMDGIIGGMISGNSPTPVADDKTIQVTSGEFVVNQPAAQKYAGLLHQINEEGKQMLAGGGWTEGYATGGSTQGRRRTTAGGGAVNHPGTTSYVGGGRNTGGSRTVGGDETAPQRYPQQVVLDPGSSHQAEFQQMDQLVRNGIYDIQQDNAGRAIYTLTNLGNAHNVRGFGSGVDNPGWAPGIENPAKDEFVSGYQAGQEGGGFRYSDLPIRDLRGRVEAGNQLAGRDLGLRQEESVGQYGPTTGAPQVTPEGTEIQYQAGQPYRVESRQQAEYWVSQGIVEVGAIFIDNNGIQGVAQ